MATRDQIWPVQRDTSAKKPKFKLPDGYQDEAAFLQEMRKLFADDLGADKLNRDAALEDLKFMVGDQWDDATRQRREAARKPVLTINRLPAFVAQVLGSRRLNETEMVVRPDSGGNKKIANVREGLIRNIQKISRAKDAYDNALAGAVMAGIGNFQVEVEYEDEDVFERKISISKIANHMSVVWDRHLTDSSGMDARHVFVVDTLSKDDFYRDYPWATPADVAMDLMNRGDLRMSGWVSVDDVRIVNYWRMRTRKRILALFNDGSTREISQDSDPSLLANIVETQDGKPMIREVNSKYAQLYICSGTDILEGPINYPITRVPVFRVPGWEIKVDDNKQRWGLIRFLKDPQRLHNFWRSVIAEKLSQTPRAVWAAADTAVAGRENMWRQSHQSDDPLLIWNAESGQKPERVPPAQVEDALLAQATITSQDIKDVSNIHEANLGMPSNEVSGAAILARQRVSDTGTILYHDNLASAISEAGRVINELIPKIYDTPRIIKVLGKDGDEMMQAINSTSAEAVDITLGKYSVTVDVGPSYQTKRIEASQNMLGLASAMPQTLAVAADLIVEAQDWPGADKIAQRLRNSMPPEMLAPDEQTPTTIAKSQAQQHSAQQVAEMAAKHAIAEFMKLQSEYVLNMAKAQRLGSETTLQDREVRTHAIEAVVDAAHKQRQNEIAEMKVTKGA